jgi:hypothetical protein
MQPKDKIHNARSNFTTDPMYTYIEIDAKNNKNI